MDGIGLINPEHKVHGKLVHNDSQKHESSFTSVKIQENNSVMLSSLAGTELGRLDFSWRREI